MAKPAKQKTDKSDKSDTAPDKKTERDHERLSADAKSILHSLPIAVVAFDKDLKIVQANSRASQLLYPDEHIDKALAKGTDEKVWLGWTEQLRSALSTSQPCTFDEVAYTLNERTTLLRITCTALPSDDTPARGGGTLVIEDVTETVALQQQLADAERLAAVGRLASKVAHELNNPMDGILRYVNLAIRIVEQEKLDKPREYLTQCRRGLMRMVQIISELLEFSRSARGSLEYVMVEQLIEDAVKTMESTAEKLDVRIVRRYGGDMPAVRCGNLFQVFCNLTKNALDAMPAGGELAITTRLEGEETIAVEFHDTGGGFDPDNADALFEPFFTTKGRGKGTGLGLAICRDILDNCRGRISARNAPEGGSVFTVHLPVKGKTPGG